MKYTSLDGVMIVSFGSAELAALLNSRGALSQRWGPGLAATIGRRLFDLSAATADSLEHLPNCTVDVEGNGEVTITLAAAVVVRGVLERAPVTGPRTASGEDHIVITRLNIYESDRR
jgi:hypothetical protein